MHPLKAARKARGMSLRQVAIRIGIPGHGKSQISQVTRWEAGKALPGIERSEKLAKLFGFQSGEEVRRLCREWQDQYTPKKERKKPRNPPRNMGKKEPHPFERRWKMHPLKEYRKICGYSLRELALKLGFQGKNEKSGATRIAHWERGECIPRYDRAEKLAFFLGFESGEEVQRLCREWRDASNAVGASR